MVEYRYCTMMEPFVYKRDGKIFCWSYRENCWQDLLILDWEEGLFDARSMIAKYTRALTEEEAMTIIGRYTDVLAERMLWTRQKDKVQENINNFIRHRDLDDRLLDMLLLTDHELFASVSDVLGKTPRARKRLAVINYYQYSNGAPCIFDENVLLCNCKTVLQNNCYEHLVPVVVNLIVQYKIVRTVSKENRKLFEDIAKKVYEFKDRPEVSTIINRWTKYVEVDVEGIRFVKRRQ